jgi:hypothetical protein
LGGGVGITMSRSVVHHAAYGRCCALCSVNHAFVLSPQKLLLVGDQLGQEPVTTSTNQSERVRCCSGKPEPRYLWPAAAHEVLVAGPSDTNYFGHRSAARCCCLVRVLLVRNQLTALLADFFLIVL